MAGQEKLRINWNEFGTCVSDSFKNLRDKKRFFDVTLAVDDDPSHTLQAHKVVLAACSPLFESLLVRQGDLSGYGPNHGMPSPLIYLRGVSYTDLCQILDFIYYGNVNVVEEDLESFLDVAKDLQINGLTEQEERKAPLKREAPPDNPPGNGSIKRSRSTPQRPVHHAPVPVAHDDQVAGPSNVADPVDPAPGPSNIKAELGEENYEGTEDYGEEEAYYEEGYEAGEGDEGMAADATGEDNSKDLPETFPTLESHFQLLSAGIYFCMACGYKAKKGDMKKHVQRKHLKGPNFACTLCDKKFSAEVNRKDHYVKAHNLKLSLKEIAKLKKFAQA